MTSFLDPSRRHVGALPCWLGTNVVLPNVELRPSASGDVDARLWVPLGTKPGAYTDVHRELPLADLPKLLLSFWADPELCLRQEFGWTEPLGRGLPFGEAERKSSLQTTSSAKDLGL